MNITNNNVNFGARYTVWGKQTPIATKQAYNAEVIKLNQLADKYKEADKPTQAAKISVRAEDITQKGEIATKAQAYFESADIQERISQLPQDTFVRLHTGILDGGMIKDDKVLGFKPFVSFEAKDINSQFAFDKKLSGKSSLQLSVDKNGELNKAEIGEWFQTITDYYA